MSRLIASSFYSFDVTVVLANTAGQKIKTGESFHGKDCIVDYVIFKVGSNGSPTGNATANIYAHTGTFGSTGTPTGSALATSDTVTVNNSTFASFVLVTFTFSGANRITLSEGTDYFVTLEYDSGDGTNNILSCQNFTGGYSGNSATMAFGSSSWVSSGQDVLFSLYGSMIGETLTPNKIRPRLFAPGNAR